MGEDQLHSNLVNQRMLDKWAEQQEHAWGRPISEVRQHELAEMLKAWDAPNANHGESRGPFDKVRLTGAEVFWLAERVRDMIGWVSDLHLEGVYLSLADLQGAKLTMAKLQGADLSSARLQGANLIGAELQGANLSLARLQEAHLAQARLQGAALTGAHLEKADLSKAKLQGADLRWARLQGADLTGAELQGADLRGAILDGATTLVNAILLDGLSMAQLQESDLGGAILDGATTPVNAIRTPVADTRPLRVRLFGRPRYGPALGDLHWGDFDLVQLTQLKGWEELRRLGDERDVTWRSAASQHRDVVRAYRQVAQRLRDQGFSDIADRLTDRAQVMQRKLIFRLMLDDWRSPWRLPGNLLRWLFSWFLALLAGYGYHPGRTVFWYLTVVAGFALAYGTSPGHALTWNEALVVSLTAFHGRGFVAGQFQPGDPIAALAAIEAVTGLFIEISFIATFTQRFLNSR